MSCENFEEKSDFQFPFDWIEILEEEPFKDIMDSENETLLETKLKEEEIKLLEKIRKKYPKVCIQAIRFYRLWLTKYFESYCLNDIVDFLVIKIKDKFYITSTESGFTKILEHSNIIKKRLNKIPFEIDLLKDYGTIIYEIMDSAPGLRIIEETLVDV